MEMNERVERAERVLNETGTKEYRRLIEIQEALKDDKKVLQLKARIKNSAPGSVSQMDAKRKLNQIYLESMTEEERDSDEGVELEIETGELHRAILESRKRVREAERVEEVNEFKGAQEDEEDDPWKLTPLKLVNAIFTGVFTFLILKMIFG
nr:MAG TPA: hypothetical protein [Caudoviricetes sp.]